ncbi:hypothetical protein EMIHUDRAFT_228970 [Emiliania huxleyi CCMP1516]|uniref:F-box domain-containing protein n=2 Tax=Emiliania huxleyi TaxID=2903 RepID=A0A0D3J640_EMIH1|nr:hypothetical protein EMIHUDRAFT_243433 [Emiliania huxleyi CCMP1516]XP_005786335.1 hypothetical protein EMIHUDRAFT_228970 [Emiliania huxleyi CCMP1516]EOD18975.1 hypothetical protein EMIHUDRAFT_243433 [Emiliania huxleyi CCMP1516]EOD33906.1 hypothetical protein EMIHUDRAFT_228970 [Emiliania huxleyi CCMP1516]|eukprot:XP_005771404.1 hypothetical protein EMIHUDRAFT_243433 [Emiliania huxleyi CCMP1516]
MKHSTSLSSLPPDLLSCILGNLGLCDLYACAKLSRALRHSANVRRDALRLLEPFSSFGTRGSGRSHLHHASALALADGDGSLLIGEKDRLRVVCPDGATLGLWQARNEGVEWLFATPERPVLMAPGVLMPNPRGSTGPCGLALLASGGSGGGMPSRWPAGPEQHLFVSDAGADRVYKLRRCVSAADATVAWALVGSGFGTGEGRLMSPGALALGEGDSTLLYVAEGHAVSAFDAGTLAFRFRFGRDAGTTPRGGAAAGHLKSPDGLVEHGGEVYVADMLNHRVQVFSASDGLFRRSFGRRGSRPGEYRRPSAVAVCRGRLLVAEFTGKRVQAVSPADGTPLQLLCLHAGPASAAIRLGPFLGTTDHLSRGPHSRAGDTCP